ncbi:MAG TPA: hypothetical protein DHD79_03900 [Firmicutes bacterium]|nr:hypothetical protein [Bacillota bacterium]HAZ21492.1 hypothetical protein [Bacillota bacterium]HBE05662.1 hypothetical protein [Bacillota bacterium]HBG44159.1 hypothetical protein [Bacillota bacterium]HBL50040.1 hypothetical protein [Bacillota bacterium]
MKKACLLVMLILTLLTFAGGCKPGGGPSDPDSVPLAPSQLVVGAVSVSTVNLQWKDNSNNETGFRVERSITTDSNFQALGNTSANTTFFTDNTIEVGKTYYYRVRAVNSAGTSNPSNVVSHTASSDPFTVPLAPSLLAVTSANASAVSLQWKDNSNNETSFRIERSVTTNTNFQTLANLSANTTVYSDNTVESGKTYYYRVRAVNSAGASNPSNSVSATIPQAEKTATLRLNNYTPYAVISFRYNGGYGWYELVNTPSQMVGASSYTDYTFWLDTNVETIQVSISVGFWASSNPADKNPRFTFTGSVTLTANQISQYNIDVSVQNVLSNFKSYSDWTGQFWTYNPTTPHSAVLRFYSDGRWYLYKDNSYIESGNVIFVRWDDYSDFIYFKLKPTGDTIQYYYPNFKFFYKNGPPDWPQIEYVLQP